MEQEKYLSLSLLIKKQKEEKTISICGTNYDYKN
jgi:hypothetical protein